MEQNASHVIESICALPDHQLQRKQYSRARMYSETRIFLNNSGSKWLSIGVRPEPVITTETTIKNFGTEVLLGGEKCFNLPLGGTVGLLQLMRQLRAIVYFKHVHVEVIFVYLFTIYYNLFLT